MDKPEILGIEVLTPDGTGSILSLHNNRVVVVLDKIEHGQVMKGNYRGSGTMHYTYKYEDITIIKKQLNP